MRHPARSDLLWKSHITILLRSGHSAEGPLKRREFQIEVKHELTPREKFLERELESKRIDKLRSILLRKQAEVSEPGEDHGSLQKTQKIARGLNL